MTLIKLKSREGELFEVELEVAQMSKTIKEMFENIGLDENDTEPLPLPKISSTILKKVIEWSAHHRDDPQDVVKEENSDEENEKSENISTWDDDFLKVDTCTLFELIMAANYLDIKGLLEASSKAVANLIEGKSPEEIRNVFNVPHPVKPGENRSCVA